MRTLALASILLSLSMLHGCQAPEGQEWIPTGGFNLAVVDDYKVEVSALGYSGSGDVEYSSFQFEAGATRVTPNDVRDIKHEFAGISFGFGDLEADGATSDLVEFSGGGRFYFDDGSDVIPFLSIWSVISDIDDPLVNTPQLSIRAGGGVEWPFSPQAALSIGADLTIPIIDAEDSTGLFESNAEGLAIRIGFVFHP